MSIYIWFWGGLCVFLFGLVWFFPVYQSKEGKCQSFPYLAADEVLRGALLLFLGGSALPSALNFVT